MATHQRNQPSQNTQLPMMDLATLFMQFWHRDAGDFKHLGVKRTYEGTNYANIEQQTYNEDISEADNILRFNMYYLMQQIQNVKNVVVHFTRLGFINLDKKDEITGNNKHSSLMGLLLMKELLKISKEKFAVLEKALVDTENKKVWELLKPPPSTAAATARQPVDEDVEVLWNCNGCTSPNPENVNFCEVCLTPRAAAAATAAGWTCEVCTSPNYEILPFCSVCETPRLVQPVAETAAGASGQGASVGAGMWTCASCTYKNVANAVKCFVCRMEDVNREVPLGNHGPSIICKRCNASNVGTAIYCVFCEGRLKDSVVDDEIMEALNQYVSDSD